MSYTEPGRKRTILGLLLTIVIVTIGAVAAYFTYNVALRDLFWLSAIFAVFVAMSIGIGMALIDVVKYFENHRS